MKEISQSIPPILLVDDEDAILAAMSRVLTAAGIENILTCNNPLEVIPLLERTPADAVLLDLSMPQMRGEDLLKQITEKYPEIPVIIVTASDDIDTAVRCMQFGAFDYMVKSVEPNRLVSGVRRALDISRLKRKYSELKKNMLSDELAQPEVFSPIITKNRKMQAAFRFIESVAGSSETILITGETGTGKELFAEAVHRASGREGELVKVNTAGLDETMFADTLFGHSRGAYTGAESARKGLVQQAEDGTLFLDEISDLNGQSQIKLLRLLESGEYYPLGSDVPRRTGARFIIATNLELGMLSAEGGFRRDLYYRLQTHEIRIPPLRERREDLPGLLDFFQAEACEKLAKDRLSVPPELVTLLETYDFPGNVRELRSMIFRAVSLQKEKMLSLQPFREAMGHTGDIPRPKAAGGEVTFPDRLPTLQEITETLIDEALSRAKGSQAIAAGMLGITPQALSKRLMRRRSGA